MIAYLRGFARFNRDTRLYLLVPAAIGISYYGMFVVLFNLYLLRLGYDTRFIGILNATGQLAFIALSLPASRLGRRWGSRRPILLAIGLYLAGFGLLPLAEFVPQGIRSAWLVGTFLLAFLGGPLYWVNSNVYLMGVTDPLARSHAFSLRTALVPLAGFVGSLLGGWLPGLLAGMRGLDPAAVGPYRDALLLAALLYLPALLAMLAAGEAAPDAYPDGDPDPPETPDTAGSHTAGPHTASPHTAAIAAAAPPATALSEAGEALSHSAPAGARRIPYRVVLPLVVVDMMRIAAAVGTIGFFNVYLDVALGTTTARIGLIAGVALLVSGAAALATPGATRRFGHRLTITVTMVGMGLFALLLALVPLLWAAALAYTGVMALSSISESSLSLFRMERVGAGLWGVMAGAAVTGQGIGEAGILFSGGFLIEGPGFPAYFITVAAVAIVGALYLWLFVPGDRPDTRLRSAA